MPSFHWIRNGMDREEFDAGCEILERLLHDFGPSCTSHTRSLSRNAGLGAKGDSHVRGLGRDYVFDTPPDRESQGLIYIITKTLGLWAQFHDAGSGMHLHVQGCAPGGSVPQEEA